MFIICALQNVINQLLDHLALSPSNQLFLHTVLMLFHDSNVSLGLQQPRQCHSKVHTISHLHIEFPHSIKLPFWPAFQFWNPLTKHNKYIFDYW